MRSITTMTTGQSALIRRFILMTALTMTAMLPGCMLDRQDAKEIRDEVIFDELLEGEQSGDVSESARIERGEDLADWAEAFEGAETLTLGDCFRLALNNSEDLALQGEKLVETLALSREAIASLLPKATFIWNHSVNSDAVKFGGYEVSPRDSTEYWISVRQKIFDGRAFAAVAAARESKTIERLTLRDVRDRVLFAAAAGFYTILGLEHDVRVLEASLASAAEFHRVLEARQRIGEASRQDTLSALAQRDRAESLLIQARHDVQIARSDLRRLLGVKHLPEKLEDGYEVRHEPGVIPTLVERAYRDRPDLEAARAAVELARADRKAALSEYLPTVTADFTRYLEREGAFSDAVDWNLSINVAWDLFDSFGREARQSMALSRIRQRELALASLTRRIRYEVEEAVLSFQSLNRALSALESRESASLAAFELAEAEYKASEATNLDVEIARRDWEEAARDLSRTRLARKLAALKIRLVIGDFKIPAPLVEAPPKIVAPPENEEDARGG